MAVLNKTAPTAISPANGATQKRKTRWGQKGVSERFYVQENTISETPNPQPITLSEAGILSELQHHHYGTYTISGAAKDPQVASYGAIASYTYKVSSNTPLVSVSGGSLGIMQIIEYPDRSWETPGVPASIEDPLINSSDYFNYPAATGIMREWFRIPLALKLFGAPGGHVGYVVLQNKRVANIITPAFNLSGASSPYSATQASGSGNAAYVGGTVTAAPNFETWKTLNTVPDNLADSPIYGFTRYWQEILQAYNGTSFTYDFEPGGELLTAVFWFIDANGAGSGSPAGMATANLSQIAYQYGVNKQMDVYTPYRNIHQAMMDYGRPLPQGAFIFDYYTPWRTLANTKSTENTANPQVVAQFSSGYNVPANSQCRILLDKIYAVQNYVAQ